MDSRARGFPWLQLEDSVVVAHALVSLQHVEPPWTRDETHVPCICRWILIHYITREILKTFLWILPAILILMKYTEKAYGNMGPGWRGEVC